MGKGRHVVIHDIIHDDNEMGNRLISYQDVALHEYFFLTHNLDNWLIIKLQLLQHQRCGVGVGVRVPQSPGFGLESESLILRRLRFRALSVSSR